MREDVSNISNLEINDVNHTYVNELVAASIRNVIESIIINIM